MLTHERHNLRLKSKLVLESTGEVTYTPPSVSSHIWYLSYLVEHMATGEHKDTDQAQACPDISILDNRQNE